MQYREREIEYSKPGSDKNRRKKKYSNDDYEYVVKKPMKKDKSAKYKRYDTEDL